MKTVTRELIAAALVFGLGCASTDWIDRTLVTVDVTGTWSGSAQGIIATEVFLELKQEGSRVTGFVRMLPSRGAAPIEGTVAGDVFRFRHTTGSLEGEVTVSGDEMTGRVSYFGSGTFSLRRVDSSSRPGPPTR